MKKLKVAMVGAGGFGRRHASAYAANPNVEFCAVCGRTSEKTKVHSFGVALKSQSYPRFLGVRTMLFHAYLTVATFLITLFLSGMCSPKPFRVC